jgi:hypothetical protein
MSWQVQTGVIEWWSDEGLRDVGRNRYHQAVGHNVRSGSSAIGTLAFQRRAFVAHRSPWRLAQVSLEEDYTYANDEDSVPVVAWADDAVVALRGTPATPFPLGPNTTLGNLGLRQMLEPEPLEQLTPRPWPIEMRLDGCLLERDMFILGAFISLGTHHYEATYEPELDVLTSWKAYIDGELAQRITLTFLTSIELPIRH